VEQFAGKEAGTRQLFTEAGSAKRGGKGFPGLPGGGESLKGENETGSGKSRLSGPTLKRFGRAGLLSGSGKANRLTRRKTSGAKGVRKLCAANNRNNGTKDKKRRGITFKRNRGRVVQREKESIHKKAPARDSQRQHPAAWELYSRSIWGGGAGGRKEKKKEPVRGGKPSVRALVADVPYASA